MRISFSQVSKFVWGYLSKKPLWLATLFLLILLQSAAEIAMPHLFGIFADYLAENSADPAGALDGILEILGWILLAGISFWTLHEGGKIFYDWKKVPIIKKIAQDAFYKVQRFSTDWHVNSFSGAIVRKITRGMFACNTFIDQFFFGFVPLTFLISGISISMFLRWKLMGVLIMFGSIVYALVSAFFANKFIAPIGHKAARRDTQLGAVLADAITCNSTVKIFGRERAEDQIFERTAEKWRKATWRLWTTHNIIGFVQAFLMTILKFGMLGLAIYFWIEGLASVGEVVFVLASYNLIASHLRSIGERIRETQKTANEMEDIVEFAQQPFQISDKTKAKDLTVERGEIEFQNVNFRYAGQKIKIYQNLSLKIEAGEKIAVVGHSGGGKTTFAKLLQRLYNLNGGKIFVDGQDVAKVTQKSLRRAIGLVPQDPILFHRSLAQNIAYGNPGASMQEIRAAAKLAHADEFISKLPKKYETPVGERGVKLSGGERQRVAIARAMLANTPILILDEATSSLDAVSEELIQDALKKLMEKKTVIIMAHRLSTIKSADRILVFENGKIVEEGKHSQLLKKPRGIYRKLFELQAGGFIAE